MNVISEKEDISAVLTVLNEDDSIRYTLQGLLNQSKKLKEIIVVDGGSVDNTVSVVKSLKEQKIKILLKKGNRSVGRNFGINHTNSRFIVITDAGCFPRKHWVENITKPLIHEGYDVVAGYYVVPRNISVYQKCLSTYTLVMKDKIDKDEFLPASRSMAILKDVWKESGGFPEQFSYNEDYVYSNKLKNEGYQIAFVGNAIVEWEPRKDIFASFQMFYKFAKGDAEANVTRPTLTLLFIRVILGILLTILLLLKPYTTLLFSYLILIFIYIIWSIKKNYKYINNYLAIFWLPALQLSSDMAIFIGTLEGYTKRYFYQ